MPTRPPTVSPWTPMLEPVVGPGGISIGNVPPPALRSASIDLTRDDATSAPPNPHTEHDLYRLEFRVSELGDEWLDVAFPLVAPVLAEGVIVGEEAPIQIGAAGGELVITPGGAPRSLPAIAHPRRQTLRLVLDYESGLVQAVAAGLLTGLWDLPFHVSTAPTTGAGWSVREYFAFRDPTAAEAVSLRPGQVPRQVEITLKVIELS